MVQELAVLEDPKTNPGLVFFEGDLKDQTKVEPVSYTHLIDPIIPGISL